MDLVKLFVARLDYAVTTKELLALFQEVDPQAEAFVIFNAAKISRGFGFASVCPENVEAAIALSGTKLYGRAVLVQLSDNEPGKSESEESVERPSPPRAERPSPPRNKQWSRPDRKPVTAFKKNKKHKRGSQHRTRGQEKPDFFE